MELSSRQMRITDAILLAAGSSSRMGSPKQMLPIGETPLLIRTTRIIRSCPNIRNVFVILGANSDLLKSSLVNEPVQTIISDHWQNGMGASLKSGLAAIKRTNPPPEQIIITVCDQPHLNIEILNQLITSGQPHKISASDYGNEIGTPALFDFNFFDELNSIPDDSGARRLFSVHKDKLIRVPFPAGSIDLDTPEDYEKFLKSEKS